MPQARFVNDPPPRTPHAIGRTASQSFTARGTELVDEALNKPCVPLT